MCETSPTAGQACTDNCADGLYCGFDTPPGDQLCLALPADGAECSLVRECTSDYCDDAAHTCGTEAPTCDGR
jgi:hypothetical protein